MAPLEGGSSCRAGMVKLRVIALSAVLVLLPLAGYTEAGSWFWLLIVLLLVAVHTGRVLTRVYQVLAAAASVIHPHVIWATIAWGRYCPGRSRSGLFQLLPASGPRLTLSPSCEPHLQ